MAENVTIFEIKVPNFSKRVWNAFRLYFFIFTFFMLMPLINLNGDRRIIATWIVFLFIIIIIMFFSARKWTRKAISKINFHNDIFEIETLDKNIIKVYSINKDHIKTLKRKRSTTPHLLILTVFDRDIEIIKLYSTGLRNNEYILEDIAFQIKTRINADA